MKNIAIVDYDMSVVGGTEQVAANLANKLSDYYHVHLISVKQDGEQPAFGLADKVQYHTILDKTERLRTIIKKFRKPFKRYIKENNIDVVIMIGDYVGAIALPTKFGGSRAKYIFCEHGALMNQWKEKDITSIRFFCAMFADKVITLTESSRNSYIKKFHIKKSRVDYIYNWIEESLISKEPYDISSKKIMSVGRLDKEKGLEFLVQVAKKVLPSHPEWEWHVYGDGPMFDEIKNMVKENQLDRQLILKGNDLNVKGKYRQYGLFALTSYREGLPLVLLEAKANHLPMISFDILTGPREIIHDGSDGYLISPYSVEKMAEKMSYLMEHDEVRAEFSKNTKEDMERFLKPAVLKLWRTLIDNI